MRQIGCQIKELLLKDNIYPVCYGDFYLYVIAYSKLSLHKEMYLITRLL